MQFWCILLAAKSVLYNPPLWISLDTDTIFYEFKDFNTVVILFENIKVFNCFEI